LPKIGYLLAIKSVIVVSCKSGFMQNEIYLPLLKSLGLSDGEAEIYQILLSEGRMKARQIVELSKLGRQNVYNYLSLLEKRGLLRSTKEKQQLFEAVDPTFLGKLVDIKKQEAAEVESRFRDTLPQLSSIYSMSTGKPTVEIFEGLEGVKKAIEDTLQAKGEILTLVDVASLTGGLAEIDRSYYKNRIQKKVSKRAIMPDTPEARKSVPRKPDEFTRIAFAPNFPENTRCTTQIYNDTVLFITMSEKHLVSVIIRDPFICAQERGMFEAVWKTADEI